MVKVNRDHIVRHEIQIGEDPVTGREVFPDRLQNLLKISMKFYLLSASDDPVHVFLFKNF